MNRKRLGLAIGKGSVSAVLIKKGFRDVEVIDQALVRFNESQGDEDKLASALQSLAQSMDLTDADCAVSLSSDIFYFRNLKSPFSDERKIRQVLAYELEPLLAVPVQDLVCDFQLIQTIGAESAVLAGAAPKARLEEILGRLNGQGVDPEIVLPSGLAWAHQAMNGPENTTADALALCASASDVSVFAFRQNRLCLVRNLLKTPVSAGCETVLARSISRTVLAMAQSLVMGFAPDQLLLTENSAIDPQALQRELIAIGMEIELRPCRPPAVLSIVKETDGAFLADAFALAVSGPGLAQGLNFRRGPLGFQPVRARKMRRLRWGAGLAAGVGLMFVANLGIENYRMAQTVHGIDAGMNRIFRSTFPETRRIVDPLHQMRQKIKQLRSDSGSGISDVISLPVTEILSYLSRQVSRSMDVTLTQLLVGGDQMTLSGETDSYNTVNEMKNRMEQGNFFSQVQISTATVNRKTGRIQFTLKVGM